MNVSYVEVPSNTITGKFEWNYAGYKKMKNSVNQVTDEEIKAIMDKAADVFNQNLNTILSILSGGVANESTN